MTPTGSHQEGDMKVWGVFFGEFGQGDSLVHDGQRFLLFADSAYADALGAFTAIVRDRIGPAYATFEYGQFGPDAHTPIIVRDSREDHDECCQGGYTGDTVELRPVEVIGG